MCPKVSLIIAPIVLSACAKVPAARATLLLSRRAVMLFLSVIKVGISVQTCQFIGGFESVSCIQCDRWRFLM